MSKGSLVVADLSPLTAPAALEGPPPPPAKGMAAAPPVGAARASAASAAAACARWRGAHRDVGALLGLVSKLADQRKDTSGGCQQGEGRGPAANSTSGLTCVQRTSCCGPIPQPRLLLHVPAGVFFACTPTPPPCGAGTPALRPPGSPISVSLRDSALLQCVGPLIAGRHACHWVLHLGPAAPTAPAAPAAAVLKSAAPAARPTDTFGDAAPAGAAPPDVVRMVGKARRIITPLVANAGPAGADAHAFCGLPEATLPFSEACRQLRLAAAPRGSPGASP